jgi:hypothetical protein
VFQRFGFGDYYRPITNRTPPYPSRKPYRSGLQCQPRLLCRMGCTTHSNFLTGVESYRTMEKRNEGVGGAEWRDWQRPVGFEAARVTE